MSGRRVMLGGIHTLNFKFERNCFCFAGPSWSCTNHVCCLLRLRSTPRINSSTEFDSSGLPSLSYSWMRSACWVFTTRLSVVARVGNHVKRMLSISHIIIKSVHLIEVTSESIFWQYDDILLLNLMNNACYLKIHLLLVLRQGARQ